MKIPTNHSIESTSAAVLSSRYQGCENILVEEFQHPAGEGRLHYREEHVNFLSPALVPFAYSKTRTARPIRG
jgi:AraC family transcriptional regulator